MQLSKKSSLQSLRLWTFYALFFLFSGMWASFNSTAFAQPDRTPHSKATLVSEVLSVQPGTPFTVALRLELEPKWHSYWKNPGDSGLATEISWKLPKGFTAGEIEWPYPEKIPTPPMMTYGYENEVWLLTTITPPADLSEKTVTLRAEASWLVCQEACLPANTNLSLELPVEASTAPQTDPRWTENFQAARAAHPTNDSNWTVTARPIQNGEKFELLLSPPNQFDPSTWEEKELYFFSDESMILDHAAAQEVKTTSDGFILTLIPSEYAEEKPQHLSGILLSPEGRSWNENGDRALAINVSLDEAASAVAGTAANSQNAGGGLPSLPLALILALGGGVLLNLMPCVFPVLSLKILGFVQQSGEDKSRIKKHGLVFGAGVLLSFWLLAGVLLLLRAAGVGVGWGFQLQSPLFVAALVFLLFAVGLNLLGAFEIGLSLTRLSLPSHTASTSAPSSPSGYSNSFSSGVLATIVATPCTAPFMGSALAFALTQPASSALLVFTFLGMGMAAPYVILSFNPAWLNKLPRPGAWMDTFKQLMAFPIFATALWLLAIFGLLTGVEGMAYLLAGLLLFGMALWLWQRWDIRTLSTTPKVLTQGGALLFVLLSLGIAWSSTRLMPAAVSADSNDLAPQGMAVAWEPFTTEKVEEALESGRPVFIDFTAAWCITCQVNKRVTLSQPEVMDAFAQRDVILLRADWTRQDETISRALESYGRSGVPTYVLIAGKGEEPQVLPEILSQSIMLSALDRIQPRLAAGQGQEEATETILP